MSTMSLRLPESLHRRAKELALEEGISINQLVATALAEKISALAAGEYLRNRAARGSRSKFDLALDKVKKSPPTAHDRLDSPTIKRCQANLGERTIDWRERYTWVENGGRGGRTVGDFLDAFGETNKVLENLGERLNAKVWGIAGVQPNGGGYSSKPGNYQRNLELGKEVAKIYRNEIIVVGRRFIPTKQ
jgi:hypothetical protein